MVKLQISKMLCGQSTTDLSNFTVKLDATCDQIRTEVAQKLNIDKSNMDLRYNFQVIPDDVKIGEFCNGAVKDSHTLIVTQRASAFKPVPQREKSRAIREFYYWNSNRKRVNTLVNFYNNGQAIHEVIESSPYIAADVIAQRIISDFAILRQINFDNNRQYFEQYIIEHPAIVTGMLDLARRLTATPPESVPMEVGTDDEEEEETNPIHEEYQRYLQQFMIPQRANNMQRVTQQQLSNALAGVFGQTLSPHQPATPAPTPVVAGSSPTSNSMTNVMTPQHGNQRAANSSNSVVTAEMLQSAIMNSLASSSTSAALPSVNALPNEREKDLLIQLNAMGFVDEEQNLRILRYCNHNLEATLDMLISQRQAFDLD